VRAGTSGEEVKRYWDVKEARNDEAIGDWDSHKKSARRRNEKENNDTN